MYGRRPTEEGCAEIHRSYSVPQICRSPALQVRWLPPERADHPPQALLELDLGSAVEELLSARDVAARSDSRCPNTSRLRVNLTAAMHLARRGEEEPDPLELRKPERVVRAVLAEMRRETRLRR
jgi:hypothetical protein